MVARILLLALVLALSSAQPMIAQEGDVTVISPDSNVYEVIAQAAVSRGTVTSTNCDGQGIDEINDCRLRCLAPEQSARGNCCCSVNSKDQLFVGQLNGCAFGHQLVQFEDTFVLESFEEASGGIGGSCGQLVQRPECICYQRWDIPRAEVEIPSIPDTNPMVTPSVPAPPSSVETPTPAPVVTPAPAPVVTPTPGVEDTPAAATPVATPPVATPAPVDTPAVVATPTADATPVIVDRPVPTAEVTSPQMSPTEEPLSPEDPGATMVPMPVETGEPGMASTPAPTPTTETDPGTPVFDEATSPEPSEEDDGSVCIEEQALRKLGYSDEHFIHKDGLVENAFCPGNGIPCGTAFHKVRYQGEDLSYRQLCERMECARRMVKVNSVYSHVWTERMIGEVGMTMFDVRYYESPQLALHWSMHVGRRIFG